MFDKRYNREIVRAGERMNELRDYEDMPYQYDNWELTPYHKQKEWILDEEAADDGEGIVLRMYEGYKETKDITLLFGKKIKKAYVCDMLEREEKELAVCDNNVSFRIKPFEIVTLKIK